MWSLPAKPGVMFLDMFKVLAVLYKSGGTALSDGIPVFGAGSGQVHSVGVSSSFLFKLSLLNEAIY